VLYAAQVERWRGDITASLAKEDVAIEAQAAREDLSSLLISVPGTLDPARLKTIFLPLAYPFLTCTK